MPWIRFNRPDTEKCQALVEEMLGYHPVASLTDKEVRHTLSKLVRQARKLCDEANPEQPRPEDWNAAHGD